MRPDRPPEERLVERLLRLADEGPELPAGGADLVKQAVRPLWRDQVRARRRRRWLWQAGLAAAATVGVTFGLARVVHWRPTPPGGRVATVVRVVGELRLAEPDGAVLMVKDTEAGLGIDAGSWVSTARAARAALELANGHVLRLDEGTRLLLAADGGLDLASGAVYLDSGQSPSGVEVRTPLAVVRDVGTRFLVRSVADELVVAVREGRVAVTPAGDPVAVPAGMALIVAGDGSTRTALVAGDGDLWAWTLAVAPPFAMEGRSVAELLEWVTEETGTSLRYADPQTAQYAAETVLHGSAEGLSPDQAPAVVLPSCGMRAAWSPGTLIVFRIYDQGG